jgi:hypothetical protein
LKSFSCGSSFTLGRELHEISKTFAACTFKGGKVFRFVVAMELFLWRAPSQGVAGSDDYKTFFCRMQNISKY